MKRVDIVRAWKDQEYLASLSAEEQLMVPPNPAGSVEIGDNHLEEVSGGKGFTFSVWTAGCCHTDDYKTLGCCEGSTLVPDARQRKL
jgi:mersacidin/lichenicidin family type 2 lantibiotic